MVFGLKLKILISAKYNTIGKGISRGAEWHKFQLHSTFQCGVMSVCVLLCTTVELVFMLYMYSTCFLSPAPRFGEGSGEIFVASCGTGVEGALTDCTLTSPAPGQCNHTHDVAVECKYLVLPNLATVEPLLKDIPNKDHPPSE